MKARVIQYVSIYLLISFIIYFFNSQKTGIISTELGVFAVIPIFIILLNVLVFLVLFVLTFLKMVSRENLLSYVLKISFILVMVVFILFLFGKYSQSSNSIGFIDTKTSYLDKDLLKFMNEVNENCPIVIDKVTKLDNVETYKNVIQFNHTITDRVVEDINLQELREFMLPMLKNKVTTNPDFKKFKNKKITFAYNYIDKNGVFIDKYLVTPEDYK